MATDLIRRTSAYYNRPDFVRTEPNAFIRLGGCFGLAISDTLANGTKASTADILSAWTQLCITHLRTSRSPSCPQSSTP